MGAPEDRWQIFSTDTDYGDPERVGIYTFAVDAALDRVDGSRVEIIEEALDTYFPTGPSWNEAHQIWVVGYTMENYEGELPDGELGPSFLQIFDPDWRPLRADCPADE